MGWTARRIPIALRMAEKLLSAGLPFGDNKGFYAQTGENFRNPLILLESLHEGDFLGEASKFSAYRWSKAGVTSTVVHMTPKNSIKIDQHSVTLGVTWTTSREGYTK